MCVDVEKLFDSFDPCKLIEIMVELEYPTLLLVITLQAHWAMRILAAASSAGPVVQVTRSVLAGCIQSVSFARGYIYPVLHFMHTRLPAVPCDSWIDDIYGRCEGPRRKLVLHLVDAGHQLMSLLVGMGLTVSSKSVVM